MFELEIDDDTADSLESLSKNVRERIFNKLISTKENPHHFFIRLVEREDFKLRVGDYRIIADIDEISKIIKVTKIGHRKNIYKNKK